MEINIQKCQTCGSRDLRNILVRDQNQSVYVQCRQCDSLVARYILKSGGYFHAGKGFESFLRSIERDSTYSSARDLQSDYKNISNEVETEFEILLTQMSEHYKKNVP